MFGEIVVIREMKILFNEIFPVASDEYKQNSSGGKNLFLFRSLV